MFGIVAGADLSFFDGLSERDFRVEQVEGFRISHGLQGGMGKWSGQSGGFFQKSCCKHGFNAFIDSVVKRLAISDQCDYRHSGRRKLIVPIPQGAGRFATDFVDFQGPNDSTEICAGNF